MQGINRDLTIDREEREEAGTGAWIQMTPVQDPEAAAVG